VWWLVAGVLIDQLRRVLYLGSPPRTTGRPCAAAPFFVVSTTGGVYKRVLCPVCRPPPRRRVRVLSAQRSSVARPDCATAFTHQQHPGATRACVPPTPPMTREAVEAQALVMLSLLDVTPRALGGTLDDDPGVVDGAERSASAGAPAHTLRSDASATGVGRKRPFAAVAAGASDGAADFETKRHRRAPAADAGNKRTRVAVAAGAPPFASVGAADSATKRHRRAPVADAEVATKTISLKTVGRTRRSPPASPGNR